MRSMIPMRVVNSAQPVCIIIQKAFSRTGRYTPPEEAGKACHHQTPALGDSKGPNCSLLGWAECLLAEHLSARLSPLSEEQLDELKELYRTTKDVRLRTRSQMILLAAEQGMTAPAIAQMVRESDQTVRNWFKRYEAEGIEGLKDAPMPGAPRKVTVLRPKIWTQNSRFLVNNLRYALLD